MGSFTTTSKRFTSAILPTTTPPSGASRTTIPATRGRQRMRTVGNFTLYLFCGIVTILVLRGTIGINYQSINDSQYNEFYEEANRIVAQIRSGIEDDEDEPSESSLTNWKSDDDNTFTYSLGPEIKNWDGFRRSWLRRNKDFPSHVNGRPRILLVTGSSPNPCDYPIGDHFLLKSIKNKMDYCRIHDIEILYNIADIDDELTGLWAKLPLIRKMMISHPEMEWIWWMDCDAMFTDMTFDIPILKYDHGYNMVLHGYPDLLLKEKSWVALNSGSFLLRNCQWSLNLLDAWATMGPKGGGVRTEAGKVLTAHLKGRPVFEADDQSALIYLLISHKDEWMDKVFLENTYFLHGYWQGFMDHYYEEMMKKYHPGLGDERWPFVTHFVGCKPCGGHHDDHMDYPLIKRCFKGMEMAFNFADDQVLNLYGFKHKGLLSPNIKRIRNETHKPLNNVSLFNIRHSTRTSRNKL